MPGVLHERERALAVFPSGVSNGEFGLPPSVSW